MQAWGRQASQEPPSAGIRLLGGGLGRIKRLTSVAAFSGQAHDAIQEA